MRIAAIELTTVSVPYTHRENSSRVNRDGVTDVIVRIVTDDGLVGWGESCSGANVESVYEALRAFEPMLLGRNPWNREALWHDAYRLGIWHHREPTFNFAWAGTQHMVGILDQVTGKPWQPWFERYVYGTEMPPLKD